MSVVIKNDEIIVKGIATHNKAQNIIMDLREFIETKDRQVNIFFEGAPGPYGEGLCLRIRLVGKPLDNTDVIALKKFFELRGGSVEVVEKPI